MATDREPGGICSDAYEAPRPLSTSLNKGEGGCVTLLASGWPLAASVE
ncbi:MAG: hypothetical protein ACLVO2_17075 [Clostridia bacterium]